jgi:hypothetical protein
MKKYYQRPMRQALAVLTAGLVLGGLVAANAQNSTVFPTNVYYMSKSVLAGTLPPYSAGGGVPAQALLAAPGITNNVWSFSWYGMRGWSTVQGTTNLGASWINLVNVAATNYAWTTTNLNTLGTSAFFRLSQQNTYVGQSACAGCHADKYNGWTNTPHSYAIRELLNPDGSFSGHASKSCLPCHTVGDNQPTGYVYATNSASSYSSMLANVGCEDCHGPAGWHKASEKDMITPAVSLDPAICGSCHQGHNPQYTEYTNLVLNTFVVTNYTYLTNLSVVTTNIANTTNFPPLGLIQFNVTHAIGGHGNSLGCGVCHQANTRMAMVKEYYDRLAGNPHPVTLFASTDADAWTAACATCHDPHGSNYVAQLRNPIFSTNWFAVPGTSSDPTPVLVTAANGVVTTNAGATYNTYFDSYYNPNVQICGQCHAGGRGMRWDGSAYGSITNLVVSTNITLAGYVPVTTYVTNVQVFTNISYGYIWTNGASVGVTNTTIFTNQYVTPYVTNQVWMASVTTYVTNKTYGVGAFYPLIAYTNSGNVYFSSNSSGDSAPHFPVQYNVLIGQLDYDLAARGGPANVLTDAHTLSPNQCADCHVPSYTSGGANVTGHKFVCDYNSPACLACHNMTSNAMAADTLNFKMSVSNSMVRVVSLLKQWGTDVAPPILRTNYGTCAWEYSSPLAYFGAKSTNAAGVKFLSGPPKAYSSTFGSYPSGTNDNVQLNYVPQDIRQARFSLYVLYEDQSYGVHNPTYTSNLLAWAENDVITNFIAAQWPATFTAGPLSGSLAANGGSLVVNFTNNVSASSYSWNFGDNSGTITAANPSHPYTTPGLYSVTCTATNAFGYGPLTRTNLILVQP